ncbi:Otogelin [Manis pentadactyla]|nr:Otogelin [Manis pentadactyla]
MLKYTFHHTGCQTQHLKGSWLIQGTGPVLRCHLWEHYGRSELPYLEARCLLCKETPAAGKQFIEVVQTMVRWKGDGMKHVYMHDTRVHPRPLAPLPVTPSSFCSVGHLLSWHSGRESSFS